MLIGEDHTPIASGSHDWENRYENGVWTYSLEDVWAGLQESYRKLSKEVSEKYNTPLQTIGAIGFSGMMHGYMAFDKDGNLLVPFRTWRTTTTAQAAEELTDLLSIQCSPSLEHCPPLPGDLEQGTPCPGYQLSDDAGRLCPLEIDRRKSVWAWAKHPACSPSTARSTTTMHARSSCSMNGSQQINITWKLQDILPKVLVAGDAAGVLTEEGAKLLDPTGQLQAGIPLCPPEGDAGTGMVATNSVAERTGNVSAGTSVFAMIVLEKELSKLHPEIDMVTTPSGKPVAMAHSNTCTSDLNAWVGLFREFVDALGVEISQSKLFEMLYKKALAGDADGGGLLAYNYLSGEPITHLEEGRPLFVRTPESRFSLSNFMRVHLFSAARLH